MTLIELLVVIFIILTITAIAIPVMTPNLQERQLRETSRIFTSVLQMARTKAIESRLPVGVVLDVFPGANGAVITLSYAEVHAPYAGGTTDARVHILAAEPYTDSNGNGRWDAGEPFIDWYVDGGYTPTGISGFTDSNFPETTDSSWIGLIRPGDVMQLDYKGHFYTIDINGTKANALGFMNAQPSATNVWPISSNTAKGILPTAYIDAPMGMTPPNGHYDPTPLPGEQRTFIEMGGLPYQIFRRPTKSALPAVQLPASMVIDLAGSGTSLLTFQPENYTDSNNNGIYDLGESFTDTNSNMIWDGPPYTLVFFPNGSLGGIYSARSVAPVVATETIHLLIGKREKVPLIVGQENWQDMTNIWVSIHPQTGLITSAEIGPDANNNGTITLAESRAIANSAQSMGGK